MNHIVRMVCASSTQHTCAWPSTATSPTPWTACSKNWQLYYPGHSIILSRTHFLYWKMRAYFLQRWLALSSEWWLIIIAGHYFEPEVRPGKVNGTYWMHVRADQYAVSATLKEIKHARKKAWERKLTCTSLEFVLELFLVAYHNAVRRARLDRKSVVYAW